MTHDSDEIWEKKEEERRIWRDRCFEARELHYIARGEAVRYKRERDEARADYKTAVLNHATAEACIDALEGALERALNADDEMAARRILSEALASTPQPSYRGGGNMRRGGVPRTPQPSEGDTDEG